MDLTHCPECLAPAEVLAREVWPSTDGPVEHVRIRCVAQHLFHLPTESLRRHLESAATCVDTGEQAA